MKNFKKIYGNEQGFTLVEVLVTVFIVVIVCGSMIQLFLKCSTLSEFSSNMSSAMNSVQNEIEDMRSHNYTLVTTDYASGGTPGNTFSLTRPVGMGVIYIDSTNPDLLSIKVSTTWKNNDGRIIGEDTNLNGTLDAGEDTNSNGQLDSATSVTTSIARK